MKLLGRRREQIMLRDCLQSGRPEFLVVYGRRRVGKTYLIREYFNNQFAFYATGVSNQKTRDQLKAFNESLRQFGDSVRTIPTDWMEAFGRLRALLEGEEVQREIVSKKRVVFLDEVPWMDTARSDFKSALDFFWNSWASAQSDLLLIVCGSATSWIIRHFFRDTGGFYNRITRQIHLLPFSLRECEELFAENQMAMTRKAIIESYMVFGGVPYYLNMFDRRFSLAQNIDTLLFHEDSPLRYEYDRLFQSLFKHSEKHSAIIQSMARKKEGMTRVELAKVKAVGEGEPLTKALSELEECGFIRKYKNFTKKKQGYFYQITDSFVLFHFAFLQKHKIGSWMSYINTPGYYSWCGNAFEMVCLNHIRQIKEVLGITGVESAEYAWRSSHSSPGAQIDLMIDRRDDVINVCEMKYAQIPFVIDSTYEKQLLHKLSAFAEETSSKKSLHLTIICADGLSRNSHSGIVQHEIGGEELFCS